MTQKDNFCTFQDIDVCRICHRYILTYIQNISFAVRERERETQMVRKRVCQQERQKKKQRGKFRGEEMKTEDQK